VRIGTRTKIPIVALALGGVAWEDIKLVWLSVKNMQPQDMWPRMPFVPSPGAGRNSAWALIARILPWLLGAVLLLGACGEQQAQHRDTASEAGVEPGAVGKVDTVGVNNLAEGDTIHTESGLTIIERTRFFGPDSNNGEVFAWEFYAQRLGPVKLVIVRFDQGREHFELVGESETVIPKKIGVNHFVLREPIPVGFRYLYGIIQPEEPVIPFKKIFNWKTFITSRPFERPLMRRDWFAMYGWRYSVRVLWRDAGS